MANIELVIKIPEGLKNDFESERWTALSCMEMKNALEKAIPLPKGHGRLIDLDQMCEDYWDGNYMEIHFNDLDNIKTIIEADKESKVNK